MERLLGYQELPSAVEWQARKRLSALAADLTDLGVSDAPLPEAAGLPALSSPGAVWGTLYVTEGATLGGRVLRRHIEARLGPVPLRFLDGHGDRTQPMWRDLAQLADQYVTTKHGRQLAQQTAVQAFAAFSTWCSAPTIATGLTFGFSESHTSPVAGAEGHLLAQPAARGPGYAGHNGRQL